jgi:predicted PhzF superfamily epimerase YddE/YHI9
MDLCGHATLATAHALKTILNYPHNTIVFETASGELTVTVQNDFYSLDFPSRMPVPSSLPEVIVKAFNLQPKEVLKSRDYVLVYDTEDEIKNIVIDRHFLDQINLNPGGVIVTAKGDACDFVSRYFTSQSTILEDPVTGSAHCSLIPFWAERLHKSELFAMQISDRVGKLYCQDKGSRVIIRGQARTYATGNCWIE